MSGWVKIFLSFILMSSFLGCASAPTQSKRPAQPISTLAAKRASKKPNLLDHAGGALVKTGEGCVWVLNELISPLDGVRKMLVGAFGVTEETRVDGSSVPPSASIHSH